MDAFRRSPNKLMTNCAETRKPERRASESIPMNKPLRQRAYEMSDMLSARMKILHADKAGRNSEVSKERCVPLE